MAFPVVETTNTAAATSSSTHTCSMPSGIVAGNLLIVIFHVSAGWTVTITTPSGWTEIGTLDESNTNKVRIYAKIAAGGDSCAITLSTGPHASISHVYRISGYSGGVVTSDIVTALVVGGGTVANPPNVSASWGLAENLFLAVEGRGSQSNAPTNRPTNYTDPIDRTISNAQVGSDRRSLEASSDDPSQYNFTFGHPSIAATIVIRPAVAALIGGGIFPIGARTFRNSMITR